MSLKKYLIIMTFTTLICWITWLVVLYYFSPDEAGFISFLLFYVSLFFACLGTFSLLGFFIRVWFSKEQIIFRHLGVATRQSLWFSVLVIITLLLQAAGFLKWWSILFLVLFLLLLEFFFLSRKVVHR